MTKSRTTFALLACGWTALALPGCSEGRTHLVVVEENAATRLGSAEIALTVGEMPIETVTAVISGERGFVTQTHTIDVTGSEGVISIFFGSLPVGPGYEVELSAAGCNGFATFSVDADTTTFVAVTLRCDASEEETGSVQVIGTIVGERAGEACDLIAKIVAAPSIQNASGPTPVIELTLNEGVTATNIVWTSSSPNGASGTFYGYSDDTDTSVTFDCSREGTVHVDAEVTGSGEDAPCTERARAVLECEGGEPSGAVGGEQSGAVGACGQCARENCASQRADVDANLTAVEPILECVLGANWEASERANAGSCGNLDVLGCYCGSLSARDCVSAPPPALDGQCLDEMLGGTACADSSCVVRTFLNSNNASGKAMQYIQCQQDFCYDLCFNP